MPTYFMRRQVLFCYYYLLLLLLLLKYFQYIQNICIGALTNIYERNTSIYICIIHMQIYLENTHFCILILDRNVGLYK